MNSIFPAGSEGTRFAFSFPRAHKASFDTEIRMTAREAATVTLSSVNSIDVIMVPAAGSATYTGDFIHRVTHGLEQKGFLLTSDTPVSVTIGCPDNSDRYTPDNILLRPLSADDTEFVIASFIGSSRGHYEKPQSFFSIAASEDNTNISIYDNDGDIYSTQILNT